MTRGWKQALAVAGIAIGTAAAAAQDAKSIVPAAVDKYRQQAERTALQIWDFAEVGYQETKSSALLQQQLRDAGFTVQAGVAGMPTGFVASYGSGKPVIGILAEFDALPGITQEAKPERVQAAGKDAGHACGHHLFGTASTFAAIAVKDWIAQGKHQGTIRVYGTPAEEGGAGKVYMVREGLFKDVDVVLHWHASDRNDASHSTSLANKSAKFRFHGVSAHAAGAPERGRSALDGVEAMNHMVNLMREHVPQETRIHYVITQGGSAPNVIPDFAEVFYYVRHPDPLQVQAIFERVEKASQGAALGTGTTCRARNHPRHLCRTAERATGTGDGRQPSARRRRDLRCHRARVRDDLAQESRRRCAARGAGRGDRAVRVLPQWRFDRRRRRQLGRANRGAAHRHVGAGHTVALLAGDRRRRHNDRVEGNGGGRENARAHRRRFDDQSEAG